MITSKLPIIPLNNTNKVPLNQYCNDCKYCNCSKYWTIQYLHVQIGSKYVNMRVNNVIFMLIYQNIHAETTGAIMKYLTHKSTAISNSQNMIYIYIYIYRAGGLKNCKFMSKSNPKWHMFYMKIH